MSGLVTINTKSRRVSRRRRNKDKTSTTTTTTTTTNSKIKPEIEPEKPIEQIVPVTQTKPKTKPKPVQSTNKKPLQESKPCATTSVWAKRAQAQAKKNQQQVSKPISKPKPKPIQRKPIPTKNQLNNNTMTQKSSLRTGRGFSARRIAHKFDPNSVNMSPNIMTNKNPKQTTEEAFPSLQKARKKKSNNIIKKKSNNIIKKKSELQSNINKINNEKKKDSGGYKPKKVATIYDGNRNSGGYRPKKVATVYDANSVDMTKKWSNDKNKYSSSSDSYNGGLSSRSNGFRYKRTFSENIKPQRSISNRSVQNESNTQQFESNTQQFESRSIRPKTHIVKYSG